MTANSDEKITSTLHFAGPNSPTIVGIGNFHKTLPHNKFGEVDPAAYALLQTAALSGDFETVPDSHPVAGDFLPGITVPGRADKLNNPQAGRSRDKLTGGAALYDMSPAPGVLSLTTAAEMTELRWMAALRDLPLVDFAGDARVAKAIADVTKDFRAALAEHEPGGHALGTDLPERNGKLDINAQTLFRCGLKGEDKGPLVSQFFLHDIAYGAQFIQQKVRPYVQRDFLTDHPSWLRAQNTGLDQWGHGYAGDNDFVSDAPQGDPALEAAGGPRRLSTMRDIARFVNKDALHQAYFNAALLCLSWDVPFDPGSPYAGYTRQARFGTFGGPDLLTRVSEVAGRALEVVWRQKWMQRRLRPEVYGGLMQMQAVGLPDGQGGFDKRDYKLPQRVFDSQIAEIAIQTGHKNYYLPIAFTAGSPPHPAYGAGHATVAGACVTVLKAWLKEDTKLQQQIDDKKAAGRPLLSPYGNAPANEKFVAISVADEHGDLKPYTAPDHLEMTVEGELNKIACNVAMGRSMGGVHWRSDNTRSLRLGEQIAAELLRSESEDYSERNKDGSAASWSFNSFNGAAIKISGGAVRRGGVMVDPKAGPL